MVAIHQLKNKHNAQEQVQILLKNLEYWDWNKNNSFLINQKDAEALQEFVGANMKFKCMHDDCFTCPYPDCIK